MSKPRKVIRSKSIYRKKRRMPRWLSTMLFVILLAFLIGFGYLVARELNHYFLNKNETDKRNETPSSSSSSDVSQDNSSDITSSKEETQMSKFKTAVMPMDVLKNPALQEDFLKKAVADGFNSVLVELKTSEGIIHYKTAVEIAVKYKFIAPDAVELAPLIQKISQAGLSPTAQIYTLMDKTAPRIDRENTFAFGTTTNVNWYDNNPENGGKPWLNPYMPNTQSYLTSIVSELSAAGFKQINLKGLHFPDKNTANMNPINPTVPKGEALSQLIEKLKIAANSVPVVNVVDAAAYVGINAGGYFGELEAIKCDNTALFIDMLEIETNKAQICEKLTLPVETDMNQVISKLIAKARQNDNTSIISPNLPNLTKIMEELNIKSSTIY